MSGVLQRGLSSCSGHVAVCTSENSVFSHREKLSLCIPVAKKEITVKH